MRFQKPIRVLPYVFLAVAGFNFIRAILTFVGSWLAEERLTHLDRSHELALSGTFRLIAGLIGVFLSPLVWIAWAAVLSVLISINDRLSEHEAP